MAKIDARIKKDLVRAQRNEITEHEVYTRLARRQKDPSNRKVLEKIAEDEKRHYEFWGRHTGETPGPKRWAVRLFVWIARLLGVTFAIKFMEKAEERAQVNYENFVGTIPDADRVVRDEHQHEDELTRMIDEERLRYVGSVILGLNDALVELTGALAGFTLALRDSRLIAVIGLITGVAAALSMAASEYLSTKTEESGSNSPLKAALYTGLAYILTVFILIGPFILLASPLLSLGVTLAAALCIILFFTYDLSVAQDLKFWPRFAEMAGLSLGVAAVSFTMGYLIRIFFGVDV